MHQEKLSIRFVIYTSKTNKQGTCPIYIRITYKKKRIQFSSGQLVNPNDWNSKKQIAISRIRNNKVLNAELSLIRSKIERSFLSLNLESTNFNVNDIFDKFLGKNIKKEEYLVSYFQKYLEKQSKLIGKDIQKSTWQKSQYVCDHVALFIKWQYNKDDYPLQKLNLQFLADFEYFLKTEKTQKQVTINKAIQRLKKPVTIAVAEGYILKNPFALHKPGKVQKEVIFLSTDELRALEKHSFSQRRLQIVKDLFIFCCYTGLAYNEMNSLKKEHLIIGFDNNTWIQMKRKKTGKNISIPLLPTPKAIINKYNSDSKDVLPKISNQKMNSYLKEIAAIVGIKKTISHHTARKTFASTVLLYNDVSMEIVSELLGHSDLKITQSYYGKVVQKKISEEMSSLSKKLNK